MFTVVGSGFGLYGYLPALVDSGERVVLPRAYEAKVRARPELLRCLAGIEWADDADAALSRAGSVVIAAPPRHQIEVAARCAALSHIERIVLEKPVAPTPVEASRVLAELDRAKKRYRVGYTMLHARWHENLEWPRATDRASIVDIDWTFMAHHFAHGLHNWKRSHEAGGGVLRFFGVHLVALLARHGYDAVRESSLQGGREAEPERWQATFAGPGLPECRVRVDSRRETERFEIAHTQEGARRALVALRDPFGQERPGAGDDPRVGILQRLLATFALDDRAFHALYARTNEIWREVENA
ncbi:MAG TPA: Gfo/Idh/MocA family oxidoreductase [Usitatibacter sp.]|nr:Gfo/Idh/MocA family oxidoreductase [Usitatibacter sp.]